MLSTGMIKIGITGGMGSGKSTVARVFETLGVPVYDADREAKNIMQRDPGLIAAIRNHFGNGAYDRTGKLNRSFLASQVFGDPLRLALLNSLVHPATIRDADAWAQRQQTSYVLKEAALMFESESFHHVDKVIGVRAPEALRIQRVIHRDGLDRAEVLSRMKNQLDERIKMLLCDYLVDNDEQHAVVPQVLALHELLTGLSRD